MNDNIKFLLSLSNLCQIFKKISKDVSPSIYKLREIPPYKRLLTITYTSIQLIIVFIQPISNISFLYPSILHRKRETTLLITLFCFFLIINYYQKKGKKISIKSISLYYQDQKIIFNLLLLCQESFPYFYRTYEAFHNGSKMASMACN